MPARKLSWDVHKFGGTSVGNAERYREVARIVAELSSGPGAGTSRAVVVSAMKGVTDGLIDLVELARRRAPEYLDRLQALKKRHLDTVEQLLRPENRPALVSVIENDFGDIREILRAVWISKSYSDRNIELISGYGEIWSAQFLNALLNENGIVSDWLDAREVLVVEPHEKSVTVDWDQSSSRMRGWLEAHRARLIVITGFVAGTSDGVATTLRRNGSDFSASIFGSILDASQITIWTDVDGVLSADPRLVPEAVILNELSYSEVAELAYFGAKVVHPATVAPAIGKRIPIYIRNTFNPGFPGTKIHESARSENLVKGFSVVDRIALINVEGTGMVGVPGIAEKLFSSLRSAGVSVIMISQASSEHSICFAIYEGQAELAKKAVESQFYGEIRQGLIQKVEVTLNCAVLAVVGDNMAHHPGVAGRFFDALGKAGVNIRAIAQGSSERNISAVIGSEDSLRALRSVHSAFYLSNHTLSVGLIGTGLIGKAFLRQLQGQVEFMKKERGIDLRIRGIMDSKRMLLSESGIPLDSWQTLLSTDGVARDMKRFEAHVKSEHLPHSVIIDATTSQEIAALYPHWLQTGMHLITPNKKANTVDMGTYQRIREAARGNLRHFLYSTNVGAGLPIIQTLRDLHRTGDRIIRIEGVFSGTLSYIFNSFTEERPFSEIVMDARARGYTEPDPRDDLSGMDVARKLVILAREIGLKLELSDVQLESLVPPELRDGDAEHYLRELPKFDGKMNELIRSVRKNGQILRYVGALDSNGNARVGLETYADSHAFGRISGSDNIVIFRTARYDSQPLIIQGPGAGPDVTAAGVFADLLRLASYLGAHS
jgi:aspartokinase/homoserine dehydrogenase 1